MVKANFLSLNFNKTYYSQFQTINCSDTTSDINYLNTTIANAPHEKFLGLVTDDTLTWDNHIDQFISRLNSVCYTTAVKVMLSRKVPRMLYLSYVHSIITYDIILWCNNPNSIKIIRMQKKKIIIK